MPFWVEHYAFTFLHIFDDNGGVMQNKTSKRKLLKNSTTTSFGSPGREGHDSSAFYETRLYADQPQAEAEAYVENPISDLDVIFNHSSEEMGELPDNSIHLMVTSPPS